MKAALFTIRYSLARADRESIAEVKRLKNGKVAIWKPHDNEAATAILACFPGWWLVTIGLHLQVIGTTGKVDPILLHGLSSSMRLIDLHVFEDISPAALLSVLDKICEEEVTLHQVYEELKEALRTMEDI